MTRKIAILVVTALVLTIVGATVAGTTMAQKGQFVHIIAQAQDDTEIVAVVQSKDVTRAEIRKPADFYGTVDPSLTKDSAVQMVIVGVIDRFIIQAEVERRSLTPTEEETRTFMQPHKDACLGPNGQECRDHIEQLGLTTAQYWSNALPDYQNDLGDMKLFQAVFTEQAPADADSNQLLSVDDTFRSDLRRKATITWNDTRLERLYNQALRSE